MAKTGSIENLILKIQKGEFQGQEYYRTFEDTFVSDEDDETIWYLLTEPRPEKEFKSKRTRKSHEHDDHHPHHHLHHHHHDHLHHSQLHHEHLHHDHPHHHVPQQPDGITESKKILEDLIQREHRDEVQASLAMRQLKGKAEIEHQLDTGLRKINVSELEDDLIQSIFGPSCICEGRGRKSLQRNIPGQDIQEKKRGSLLRSLIENPPITVAQSAYVKRLVAKVEKEIEKADCPLPSFSKKRENVVLYRKDDTKKNSVANIYQEPPTEDTIITEPEDKLMARLQIYVRAFTSVIHHFTALRPILIDIKRNYDSVLALKERQITELRFIKRGIAYKENSMDEYLADLRYDGYAEMSEMEKKSYILLRHIDKQDEVIKTMTEILLTLENSLEEEHEMRKEADDQKRILVQEFNELRRKITMPGRGEDGQNTEEVVAAVDVNAEEEALNTDDPVIIRAALQTCRKNLSDAQYRLTILEADYADVIPRTDFESTKQIKGELEQKHNALIESYNVLSSQVQGLKDQIEKLVTESDENEELITNLNAKATPRPSWTRVGDYVAGGAPAWMKSIEGQSSNSITDKIIEELTGRKITGEVEYLQPLGSSATVPKFLRYDAPVQNRYLSVRDAAVEIHDIWQVRSEHLEAAKKFKEAKEDDSGIYIDLPDEPPPLEPFSDYLASYFTERCHLQKLRMERIYNLMDACKRITTDRRLVRFLNTANDKLDESVYHLFRTEVLRLRNILLKKSSEENQPPGTLPKAQFIEALQGAYPTKPEDDINALLKAASKQIGAHANWTVMKYSSFFVMTDEGLIGEFVDEIALQFERERLKYIYEVLGDLLTELGVSLQSAEREEDPAGDTDVSMQQFYSAFINVDPQITEDKIGAALAWVFAGVSTLPGLGAKGIQLVHYIKSHLKPPNTAQIDQDEEEPDENDDEDFERAMKAVTARDDDDDDQPQLTPAQRRNLVKQMKLTNLRNVVKRLKGGAFLRTGPRFAVDKDVPEISEKQTQDSLALKTNSKEMEPESNEEEETDLEAEESAASITLGSPKSEVVNT